MKNKKSVHERIMGLNTENFLKLNLRELCEFREKAEPQDQKRLDFIQEQAELKERVRDIFYEEMARIGFDRMSWPEKKIFIEVGEKELEKLKKSRNVSVRK